MYGLFVFMDYRQSPPFYHNDFSTDAQRDGRNDHMKRCNDRNFYGSRPNRRQIEEEVNSYYNPHIEPLNRFGGDFLQNGPSNPSCLVTPRGTSGFTLNVQRLSTLPNFYGSREESPYDHMDKFVEVVRSMLGEYPSEEEEFMQVFRYSLGGESQRWLYFCPPRSIFSWPQLQD